MPRRQQRLRPAYELDRDQRRARRCITGGVSQRCNRLFVAPFGTEHQMVRDMEPIRASGRQRFGGLTVQQTAGRRGYLLIDRVVHELMPEYNAVVGRVEQLRGERLVQLADDFRGRPARHRGDVAQRHRVAEHCRDLQELQRRGRQVSKAANNQGAQRSR